MPRYPTQTNDCSERILRSYTATLGDLQATFARRLRIACGLTHTAARDLIAQTTEHATNRARNAVLSLARAALLTHLGNDYTELGIATQLLLASDFAKSSLGVKEYLEQLETAGGIEQYLALGRS